MESNTRKLNALRIKLKSVENQRERNINRYILPLEQKIEEIEDKIKKLISLTDEP